MSFYSMIDFIINVDFKQSSSTDYINILWSRLSSQFQMLAEYR